MNPKPDYALIGVKGTSIARQKTGCATSPSRDYMIAWGRRRGVDFVIRYWPSKRGWRALDIRNVFEMNPVRTRTNHMLRQYGGAVQGERVFPTEDACVMYMMTVMNGSQMKLL